VAPSADRAPIDEHEPLHASALRPARLAALSPAIADHVQRARRAEVFMRAGRHAAAERLLRDVAAALARRQAREPCARVLVDLGRLLLVRGRADAARRAFADAREAAGAARVAGVGIEAALWEAGALTDAARLDDAGRLLESIERPRDLDAPHRAWADACEVRLALWRGELAAVEGCIPAREPQADAVVAAWIESTAVRALLASQRRFEAGRRACDASALAGYATSAHARAIVERARLLVHGEAGDLEGAAACLDRLRRAAREARTPLASARGTLAWVELLRRAGLDGQAGPAWRALRRTATAAPPLLRQAIERALPRRTPPQQAPARVRRSPPAPPPPPSPVPEIAGPSAALGELRRAIVRAAAAPFAVLIEGESGAGKELVARAIHRLSARGGRRFCDLNCAALPDELVEAELFGHARGAFTGAPGDRPGLFEEASGGTLFLDEVSELSGRAQAKLLRVIQQQEVRRLGETQMRPIDVRVVAAANRSMAGEVSAGRFRADLLYRLDVVRLRVPPLRERPEDVPVLAGIFWQSAAARVGSRATLGEEVRRALAAYAWPGNVRELQNVLAALAVMAPPRGLVPPSLLPARIREPQAGRPTLADVRGACEREAVRAALGRAGGCRTQAARELGITRQGLLKTMRRLKLPSEA
jgi:DNA-binding NtrC family response regulator